VREIPEGEYVKVLGDAAVIVNLGAVETLMVIDKDAVALTESTALILTE
jgi:hypothetical protein